MRLAFAPFLALLVASCNTSPSAQTACTKSADETCDQLMTCSSADFQRRWPDLTTCEQRQTLACTEALAAPKNANNPDKVEACSNARQAQTCEAYLSGVMPPQACLTPDGPLAIGAACSFAGQCSTGFCAIPPTSVCGTCAAEPNPGDSCAMQSCGQTMVCVASTMQCQVPLGQGGSCNKSMPCGVGLACVGSTATANGTCMPQGSTVGATCDVRNMTAPTCSPTAGLTCDTSTNTCQVEQLVGTGQQCGVVGTVVVGCSAGGFCQRPTGSATGTCVAPATDGGACDTANGPDCIPPARCITSGTGTAGTCQLPGSMSC